MAASVIDSRWSSASESERAASPSPSSSLHRSTCKIKPSYYVFECRGGSKLIIVALHLPSPSGISGVVVGVEAVVVVALQVAVVAVVAVKGCTGFCFLEDCFFDGASNAVPNVEGA